VPAVGYRRNGIECIEGQCQGSGLQGPEGHAPGTGLARIGEALPPRFPGDIQKGFYMKLVEGFRLRQLGGEFIVTPESVAQINFNKLISLNSSAAYLWKSVEGKEFTADTLKDLLLDRYEVSEEIAARDAESIARTWVEAGIAVE
jgi:hypothetical protein